MNAITPTATEVTPNIALIPAAIAKVMTEVGSVEKRGRNDFHKYAYATAADILHALQPLMAREGLIVMHTEVGREVIENDVLAVKYRFTLVHTSGAVWPEAAEQTGMTAWRNSKGGLDDKAANKCLTAALKYYLLSLFKIPTGDYPDADGEEDKPKSAPKAAPQKAAPKPNGHKVSPPADPETGEVSPHAIRVHPLSEGEGSDWRTWATSYANALKSSVVDSDLEGWIGANLAAMGNCASAAPKLHARLLELIEERRAFFSARGSDDFPGDQPNTILGAG